MDETSCPSIIWSPLPAPLKRPGSTLISMLGRLVDVQRASDHNENALDTASRLCSALSVCSPVLEGPSDA